MFSSVKAAKNRIIDLFLASRSCLLLVAQLQAAPAARRFPTDLACASCADTTTKHNCFRLLRARWSVVRGGGGGGGTGEGSAGSGERVRCAQSLRAWVSLMTRRLLGTADHNLSSMPTPVDALSEKLARRTASIFGQHAEIPNPV